MQEWIKNHQTMVILGLNDEEELINWEKAFKELGLKYYSFRESYYGNSKTALALEPIVDGAMFSELKLL